VLFPRPIHKHNHHAFWKHSRHALFFVSRAEFSWPRTVMFLLRTFYLVISRSWLVYVSPVPDAPPPKRNPSICLSIYLSPQFLDPFRAHAPRSNQQPFTRSFDDRPFITSWSSPLNTQTTLLLRKIAAGFPHISFALPMFCMQRGSNLIRFPPAS
jgi:hypothetical protein